MSMKKATLASLILLSLTACSSGGGSADSTAKPANKPSVQQPSKQAQDKEKQQAQKAQVEAEKLLKEKEVAEKTAKEAQHQADQARATLAEAEKLKVEAERAKQNAQHALNNAKNQKINAEKAVKEAQKQAQEAKIALENANKAKVEIEKSTVSPDEINAAQAKAQAAENLAHNAQSELAKATAAKEEAERLLSTANSTLDKATQDKLDAEKNAKQAKADADKAREAKKLAETKSQEAKVEAEKFKQEADRLIKEAEEARKKAEAERIAFEKARKEKLESLTQIALRAGLTEEEAKKLASDNFSENAEDFIKLVDKFKADKLQREIDNAKGIVSANYKLGLTDNGRSSSSSSTSSCVNFKCTTWSGTEYSGSNLYNQKYSVVKGTYRGRNGELNGRYISEHSYDPTVSGLKTKTEAIPLEGQATYIGKAFDGNNIADLNYTVDFNSRTGSGTVTGLGEKVELEQGSISKTGISSTVSQSYKTGNYSLDFYGPKAEEVSGKMVLDNDTYGLAGTRGEITK